MLYNESTSSDYSVYAQDAQKEGSHFAYMQLFQQDNISIYANNKQQQDIGGARLLFGKIRDLCVKRNINISTLERETQLGRNTIYRWDESSPSANKLKRVADYFGVTVDELLKEEST